MSILSESVGNQSQLQAALDAGLDTLDRGQSVTFTMYQKTVLPADGYVFWVATGQIVTVQGSVHYGIDKQQNEDETIAINRVIFTAESQIQQFDAISPTTMFLGTFEGIRFAFSRQGDYYQQANLWHYVGDAVYPALASQIVQSAAGLAALEPIVSNSLPIWLAQNSMALVYPSFAVPDNIVPPYIVAHIEPEMTEALGGFPLFVWPGVIEPNTGASPFHALPSEQLCADNVRLTLYGFNNQMAIQFFTSLMQYSLATDDFGFMNSPVVQDAKRTQVELGVLAQKKVINIKASYYQSTAAALAVRLILSATVTETIV